MSDVLEAVMLLCFGLSWPISLIKNIKAKSAKAMSLQFSLLIVAGYLAGITAKLMTQGVNYVLIIYLFNLTIVTANIVVYFVNKRFDKIAETGAASIQSKKFTAVSKTENNYNDYKTKETSERKLSIFQSKDSIKKAVGYTK